MSGRKVIAMLSGGTLAAMTALVVIVAAGCGTTELTNLWKDPAYSAPPLKKLIVVAFRKNPVNRRMWEDAIVAGIGNQKSTASAVPSYQLFPDEIPQPEAIQDKAKDQGFDGVLTVARVERDTLTNEVPGYTTDNPVTRYNRKWKTYVTHYETVFHPGYTDTSMAISVRTDLFVTQAEEGQLVWSATSKAVDPASRDEFRAEVAATVAKQLSKAHLIP